MSTAKRTSSKMKNSASGPKKVVSPMPEVFTNASARLAQERVSRVYALPVIGSSTSQNTATVGWAKNGSTTAVSGSGIRIMSDSLMAFQPAIDEPSNMMPFSQASASMVLIRSEEHTSELQSR